jgi:predicted nucleic acid-binding Zn ribbon protein
VRLDHPTYDCADWKRTRCRHCGRPLRIANSNPPASPTCCETCQRLDRNTRNKLRRRVEHEPITCIVCEQEFIPKRSDAKTCSNKCRQALHRERHREGQRR